MMNPMNMGMMNNQMQGMGNMNIQNNGKWNLFFIQSNGGKILNVVISPDQKFQEAVNLYLQLLPEKERAYEMKFIFNSKELNKSLSISECGLEDSSQITVIVTKGLIGA